MCEIKFLCQADFRTTSGHLELLGYFNSHFQRKQCVTPVTVSLAKLQLHKGASNHRSLIWKCGDVAVGNLVQCFTMFLIRSIVNKIPLPPVLCELSLLEIKLQVGRCGSKACPEGVDGRRGQMSWPENLVDNLALGFESLYPAVP